MSITPAKVLAWVAEVKKALAAAAAVAVVIGASNAPDSAKGWAATALAVLASFGVTYQAKNKAAG